MNKERIEKVKFMLKLYRGMYRRNHEDNEALRMVNRYKNELEKLVEK